jgi:mono/diheme cytochrome c family protein
MVNSVFKIKLGFIALLMAVFSYSQEINGDAANGYALFKKNCTSCHSIDAKVVGPALGGVVSRLEKEQGLGREWFQKWIKNNNELRESGDAYAKKIYAENGNETMNLFPDLSEQDIDDILSYTSDAAAGEAAYKKAQEDAEKAKQEELDKLKGGGGSSSTGIMIIGFGILAVLLTMILFKVNTLASLVADPLLASESKEATDYLALFEKIKKPAGALLAILSLIAFYGVWNAMLTLGVDKGYKPEQPIYFSHKIHAGQQSIDCQYCHSSAKYSKVAGIPSTNVCMNCHKVINEYTGEYTEEGKDKKFYTGEIQKIYNAIGWDPSSSSYTGVENPVKWTRIHNMPDFVYFNHSQHVVAGEKAIKKAIANGTIPNSEELKLEPNDPVCFACHGNVDEMEEIEMANKFTMGWCIECHRTTEVDMENGYNKEYYAEMHDKLKAQYGEDTTTTVDAIGGMECGKCHY